MYEPTFIDQQSVTNGNELLTFLNQFQFWDLKREGSGRMVVVIRIRSGNYVTTWGRKNETDCEIVDRLRMKLLSEMIANKSLCHGAD